VGMGVLPLVFEDGQSWQELGLTGSEQVSIAGVAALKPRQKLLATITYADATSRQLPVLCRIDTEEELSYYRHGGILPFVLRNLARAACNHQTTELGQPGKQGESSPIRDSLLKEQMSILQQANGLPEQGSHCLMRCLALLGLAIGFAGGSGFAQSPGFAPSQAVGPSPSAGAASAPAAVVELYTSQGCSSCPAADALLAQLANRSEVVALSLSVDYWDYL